MQRVSPRPTPPRPGGLTKAWKAAAAAALAAGLLAGPVPAARASCHAVMTATFIPTTGWADGWNDTRTAQELTDMAGVGITLPIVVDALDVQAQKAYYIQGWYPQGTNIVGQVAHQLALRHTRGIFGLVQDTQFLYHEHDMAWLQNLLALDEKVASQVYARVGAQVQAWYIPNEIDDYSTSYSPNVGPLTWFFTTLADWLHTHAGSKPVMAAPFFQWQHDLPAYASTLAGIMAHVDIINLQDGTGERPGGRVITDADVTALFQAVHATVGAKLWDDPDMYNAVTGGPADPAALQAHLNDVCGLVSAISGFSFPSQMVPENGKQWWYNAYRQYVYGYLGDAPGTRKDTAPRSPADQAGEAGGGVSGREQRDGAGA